MTKMKLLVGNLLTDNYPDVRCEHKDLGGVIKFWAQDKYENIEIIVKIENRTEAG